MINFCARNAWRVEKKLKRIKTTHNDMRNGPTPIGIRIRCIWVKPIERNAMIIANDRDHFDERPRPTNHTKFN